MASNSVKKCNVWLVPQSMIVGAAAMAAVMLVPSIRASIVSALTKISDTIGLKG